MKILDAQPAPPLTMRQRIFVIGLLLLALVLSFVVVRFIDPTVSATDSLQVPTLQRGAGTTTA